MKVLIVYAHPDWSKKCFNGEVLRQTKAALEKQGHYVRISDLYEMRFTFAPSFTDFWPLENPSHIQYDLEQKAGHFIREIAEEQEKVRWATHIIIQAPIWWRTLQPAILSWQERVLANGFAYTPKNCYENGPMKGKKVMIVCSTGGGENSYKNNTPTGTIEQTLIGMTLALDYCGFDVLKSKCFYGVQGISDDTKASLMADWVKEVEALDQRPKIPFVPHSEIVEGTSLRSNMEILDSEQ